MAKVCFLCAKSTMAGHSIQHKHSVAWRYKAPKSNRTFEPNLRNIDIEVDGVVMKVQTCMKCYKKLRKESKAE